MFAGVTVGDGQIECKKVISILSQSYNVFLKIFIHNTLLLTLLCQVVMITGIHDYRITNLMTEIKRCFKLNTGLS